VSTHADIAAYDTALKGAPERTALWAMVETARALFQLEAIASLALTTRLSAFVLGLNDLAREMGARQTADRAPFWSALSLSVAAARAHGLIVLDSVCNAIGDDAALEQACRQGADFGFDGKTLIHPSQIEICNRVFSPDPAELEWARAVIEAYARPENAAKGALQVGGRMAERLHLEQSRRLVSVADAIAEAEAR
jgi:citrate lyase subunit beta/citryl-CoA lyase